MTQTVGICPVVDAQFFNNLGKPLDGGKLFFYTGGSWSSEKTTYSDSQGTIPNDNPIVLNSSGRPETDVWLTLNEPYNITLTLPNGATVLNSWENVLVVTGSGGGGANTVPGGTSFQVQYNNAGQFAGNTNVEIVDGVFTTHNNASINNVAVGQGGFNPTAPSVSWSGLPTVGDMQYLPGWYGYTLPASYVGSTATAQIPATSSAIFTITSDNGDIGTVTFNAGSTVGVFAGSGVTVQNNLNVWIVPPDPQDATLSDVTINFAVTNAQGYNVAIGNSAGSGTDQYNIDNISIGYLAAESANGSTNLVIGNRAHQTGENSYENVIVGNDAHQGGGSLNYSVVIGKNALGGTSNNTEYNTIVGHNAGLQQRIQNNNVFVGSRIAAYTSYEVSGSTIIGDNIQPTGTTTNQLLLGANGTLKLRVNESGAFSVGPTENYGTSGYFLKSNGPGAAPSWVTPPAGGLTPISIGTNTTLNRTTYNNALIRTYNSGITLTIGTSFTAGDAFVIINYSAGPIYITTSSPSYTLTWAGTALTGQRTLIQSGICSVVVYEGNIFFISGSGLS